MKYTKGWVLDEGEGDVDYFPEDTDNYNMITRSIFIGRDEKLVMIVWSGLEYSDSCQRYHLEEFFEDWRDPTKDEAALFELEHGFSCEEPLMIFKNYLGVEN